MAARLPVVAYGVGGIPESVVDGETGLLVTQGDVGAAAEAVCRLVADPALRSRMGEAGRRRVFEHFTAEATARKVDMVIQSVIQRRRPRSG
jgi:glycosyltransferase involved in cell wall biosynthesis